MTQASIKQVSSHLQASVALLLEVQKSPHLFSDDTILCDALRSQGGFAGYTNADRGLIGIALNTQRKYADEHLDGGFRSLNAARKAAAEAIVRFRSATAGPVLRTKAGLLARARELEEDVHRLEGDLEVMSDMLARSMRHARAYAEAASSMTRDRCRKEQAEILALLGPRAKPRMKVVA
jgi:hypothetical protein